MPLEREQVIAAMALLAVAWHGATPTRLARVLRDWLPFVVLLWAYDISRGAAKRVALVQDLTLIGRAERDLFNGLPTIRLQHALLRGPPSWWEAATSLLYISHFIVPFAVALAVSAARGHFHAWRRRVIALSAIGLIGYCAIPTAPPWMAGRFLGVGPVQRSVSRGFTVLELPVAARILEKGQQSVNLVAAMPSLHAAFPMLLLIFAVRRRAWKFVPAAAVYTAAMAFTLVLVGEHYVLDVAGGWIAAAVATAAVEIAERRWWPAPGGTAG